MSESQRKIHQLLSSKYFQQLATFKPPFNPLDVLGVERRELSHSNVLAWLLRDDVNSEFRLKFFARFVDSFESYCERDFRSIRVNREFLARNDEQKRHLDLLIIVPKLNIVVAIEVKVDAPANDNQIFDYQNYLARRYPSFKKLVLLLTKNGDTPESACHSHEVQVKCISWREIGEIINECSGLGDEYDFRTQFGVHILRNLLMESEERNIILSFLSEGNNKKMVRRIFKYYPNLVDQEYKDKFMSIVAEVLSEISPNTNFELNLTHHSNRKPLNSELHISVNNWNKAGLPFYLVLYSYEKSAVRVLLVSKDKNKHKDRLQDFSQNCNGVISSDYPNLNGWDYWCAVFANEGDQEEVENTLIEAKVFDESFWEQVKDKLRVQLEILVPRIDNWLEDQQAAN